MKTIRFSKRKKFECFDLGKFLVAARKKIPSMEIHLQIWEMSRASDCHEMKVNNEDIKDFFVKHFKGNLYSKKLPLTSSSNLLLNSLQNENLNSYRTFSLSFEKVEHFFLYWYCTVLVLLRFFPVGSMLAWQKVIKLTEKSCWHGTKNDEDHYHILTFWVLRAILP